MSKTIDVLNPQKPKRRAIVASNPSVSKQTGWPIAARASNPEPGWLKLLKAGII